jgi:hypothetical protein
MEGRFPSARSVGSPTGGWKPPLLQTTADGVNWEMHPARALTTTLRLRQAEASATFLN